MEVEEDSLARSPLCDWSEPACFTREKAWGARDIRSRQDDE